MKLTRRHVLAAGAAATAAAAVGASAVGLSWWDRPPAEGFRHLSPEEATFARALGAVTWPATTVLAVAGDSASLDHFVDETLDGLPAAPRGLFKLLLHFLDHWPLASHGSAFVALDQSAQNQVLLAWLHHDLAEVRLAAHSVLVLLGMGFATHPGNAPWFSKMHGCGYGR